MRGREVDALPPAVRAGVMMHRQIDLLTDTHPAVRTLNRTLSEHFGRYATVLSDIAFDYYLFRHWPEFGPMAYEDFCDHSYACILRARPYMPARARHFAYEMVRDKWLRHYTSETGMNTVFARMRPRVSRPELLGGVETMLRDYDADFNRTFLILFPALQRLADDYRPATTDRS